MDRRSQIQQRDMKIAVIEKYHNPDLSDESENLNNDCSNYADVQEIRVQNLPRMEKGPAPQKRQQVSCRKISFTSRSLRNQGGIAYFFQNSRKSGIGQKAIRMQQVKPDKEEILEVTLVYNKPCRPKRNLREN